MENIFAFLVGVSGKVIDEIDDQQLKINEPFTQALKSLNICLLTLASRNDFLFALSTLILALCGAGVDTYYWKSFIVVGIVLSTIYFSAVQISAAYWLLFIFMVGIITHVEEAAFPEEYSIKKLISRVSALIVCGAIFLLPGIFIPNYIRKLILIAIGGLVVSIISQIQGVLRRIL